ncbi:MAG: hypothetical protein JJU00_15855 [Opitutales bacterium]|nr:hypothetical protein [Opitutales bacterium]
MRPTHRPTSAAALAALFLLAAAALPSGAGASVFKSVYTRHMETGQFQYIGEFFSGKETVDNRVLLRTDPGERTGLYVIAELKPRLRDIPAGASLALEMIRSDANEIHVHEFPLPTEPARARILYVGLTGADWPESGERLRPVAWRLRLLNSAGDPMDTWSSFLWEMP